MSAPSRWRLVPADLHIAPGSLDASLRGWTRRALPTVVGLACFWAMTPRGFAAPHPATGERTPAPLLADDGFTRESLAEFDAPPEPPPLQTVPVALIDEQAGVEKSHTAAHHRRKVHPRPAAEEPPRDVVIKESHHRNPMESVVYWWNGWVIRNFHTRNGTVLLDTIGAKT